ncbi:MAG: diguanylate cyclase [Hyphomicrobiales bacterium]|nr:diguanylate cyclase [Hyphomicrobiales bacterium]MCP5371901.1 diguanylate cyclase [Hyphomicrobiales bacterium]
MLIATMVAVCTVVIQAVRVLEDSRANWLAVDAEAHDRFLLLAGLQGSLGYGGMIHNFKNFVLRGEAANRQSLRRDLRRAEDLVARYRTLELSPDEAFALKRISTVIAEYREKFAVAEGMVDHGARAEDIDQVVRIDDEPALDGLRILYDGWHARADPAHDLMDRSMQRGVDLVRYGFAVIPVILLAAVLVLWLVNRLTREIALSDREEQRARFNEAKFRGLIEGSLQGVMILKDDRIVFANDALARMFGYDTVAEVLRADIYRDFMPDDEVGNAMAVRDNLMAGNSHSHDYRAVRKRRDGSRIWVDVTVHAVDWEDERAYQVLYIDISDQVRFEHELMAEKERVEQHAAAMAELNENLHYARMEAEEKQRELHALSITDPLTGAYNRRHFLDCGGTEIRRRRRFGEDIAVLMLDVDHFKKINDVHGHAVGDLALLRLTEEAHKLLREVDVCGRLGGEEFAVLLPQTDEAAAQVVAERLRRTLAKTEVKLEDRALTFTVSIGVAMLEPDDTTVEPALNRADKALYAAKAGGRNRVVVYRDALLAASGA